MSTVKDMIIHCLSSVLNAYTNTSKLSPELLEIEGYSGNKTRHLYNNICNVIGLNYLEIGTWKGSSFCSALYKNTNIRSAIAVDNWSQFNGPKNIFLENTSKFLSENRFRFIEKDCWELTNDDIPDPIHIYMYDGDHSYESHKKAITKIHPFLAKYSIVLIDDWVVDEWKVRQATYDGIQEMNMKIHYTISIGLVNAKEYHTPGDTFWNGCGIFVLERTDI